MTMYIDKNGYYRFSSNDRLVHRERAYHEIYLLDRWKYPLPFSFYQVHHRDGNKLNNDPSNLELLIKFDHEYRHGIESAQMILPFREPYASRGYAAAGFKS